MLKTMNELERLQLLPELQEVDVCEAEPAQAIPKACGFEAATQCKPAEKKSDWKKQSQFAAVQVGVMAYLKGDYENIPGGGAAKNKANSKPILFSPHILWGLNTNLKKQSQLYSKTRR